MVLLMQAKSVVSDLDAYLVLFKRMNYVSSHMCSIHTNGRAKLCQNIIFFFRYLYIVIINKLCRYDISSLFFMNLLMTPKCFFKWTPVLSVVHNYEFMRSLKLMVMINY
jgi:hypothetical protein